MGTYEFTVKQKPLQLKAFQKERGFLSHILARKRTKSWDLQSTPPAAGLNGKDLPSWS